MLRDSRDAEIIDPGGLPRVAMSHPPEPVKSIEPIVKSRRVKPPKVTEDFVLRRPSPRERRSCRYPRGDHGLELRRCRQCPADHFGAVEATVDPDQSVPIVQGR